MENIVTSKENPVIKLYRKLSSSKKERLQYGLFVLEGLRIVEDALREDSNISHLIMTKSAYEKLEADLSLQADLRNTKTIVISNELGNKIAATNTTQGVFAICTIPPKKIFKAVDNGKYAVLFGLQDPGNVGMIIRTADALGIDGVILSQCCDIYSPKSIRATMGSVFREDIYIENDENALFEMLEKNGVLTLAAVVGTDAESIKSCSCRGAQAVFIGNEGSGLPSDTVMRCNRRVTICMSGTVNSLNAAMAAGILMWELKKNE